MEFQAFIFDLDGTIVSTEEYHYLAWKKIAEREGIPFDRKIGNLLRGISRMDSLNIILEQSDHNYSEEEKLKLTEDKNRIYWEYIKDLGPNDMIPHVKEVLDYLHQEGYLLAVGSSSKNTKAIVSKIGLSTCFDAIADGTEVSKGKPDPEVFLKAAAKLGIIPEECVVVEDAESGIKAAKSGHMLAIAVSDARKSPLADISIDSMAEIMDLFPAKGRFEHKIITGGIS